MSSAATATGRAQPRDADVAAIAHQCRALVRRRARQAALAAAVPLPGFGLAVDLGVLMRMLEEINAAFGLTPSAIEALPRAARGGVYRAMTSLGASAVGRAVTRELVLAVLRRAGRRWIAGSILRYVPFAGQLLAAGLSYGAMRLVGERHIADCVAVLQAARGGTRATRSP